MTQNKTAETKADVDDFLDKVADDERREDAKRLCRLLEDVSGEPPRMWGNSMVGFGRYHYHYESGREGEAMRIGFSPRAKELVLYLTGDFPEREALLARLGKHRTGKSCLYLKRLADVDAEMLRELACASLAHLARKYPD